METEINMQLVLKAAVIAVFTLKSQVTTVIGPTGAVGKQLRLKRKQDADTAEKLKNLSWLLMSWTPQKSNTVPTASMNLGEFSLKSGD